MVLSAVFSAWCFLLCVNYSEALVIFNYGKKQFKATGKQKVKQVSFNSEKFSITKSLKKMPFLIRRLHQETNFRLENE